MSQASVLPAGQILEEETFTRQQAIVVAMCGALVAMDGFDVQAIGFVAPDLARQLNIARGSLGSVFSSGLLGMMLGALTFGPIADRLGRKPVLVACSLIFGVLSLLTAAAGSLQSLLIVRFLTGLGLGGAMPNAIALTSESTPKKFRATAVTVMFCGFSIGAAVGGFVSAGLIERLGWQSVFIVGGVLPCIMAVLLFAFLPESKGFLQIEHRAGAGAVKGLFDSGRALVTLLLWVMFFMNLLDLYFLNNWLPTVMNDAGIPVRRAIIITTLFQVGGTVGALTLGRIIDRRSSYHMLAWMYLLAAASIFFIGAAGATIALLVCAVFAAGVGVVGGQMGANVLASEFYPTAIRSTGVGWALGIGRVGSIIGPVVGGFLLSLGGQPKRVFWAAAVPAVIASMAAFTVAFMRKHRSEN